MTAATRVTTPLDESRGTSLAARIARLLIFHISTVVWIDGEGEGVTRVPRAAHAIDQIRSFSVPCAARQFNTDNKVYL